MTKFGVYNIVDGGLGEREGETKIEEFYQNVEINIAFFASKMFLREKILFMQATLQQ